MSLGGLAEGRLIDVDVEQLQEFSSHLFGRGEHVRLEPSEKGVVERIKARILQRGGACTIYRNQCFLHSLGILTIQNS